MPKMRISNAPSSWGVDDPKNPNLPSFERVLKEASQAGYHGIELGPWGYMPKNVDTLNEYLEKYQIDIVAGTIFDNLVDESRFAKVVEYTHDICRNLQKVRSVDAIEGQKHTAPYLTVMDFASYDRANYAGRGDIAPRLPKDLWSNMIKHIKVICKIAREEYGVRPVIHTHAGGCIEFEDELEQIINDIPYDEVGLCLDLGHLYYAGMDPLEILQRYMSRIDYLHFKDVNELVYRRVTEQRLDFFAACAQGVLCPIGKGVINYSRVFDLLSQSDYRGWITLEQERDPLDAVNSLDDVKQSLSYLENIGFSR